MQIVWMRCDWQIPGWFQEIGSWSRSDLRTVEGFEATGRRTILLSVKENRTILLDKEVSFP